MLPLFDMFMNAQNGEAMAQMARQFGLTQSQAEDALAALMPAFSTGLKRNAADPMGVGAFLQALATGSHQKYFENMASAFTPAGVADGNTVLGQLFGSKEVSRAVAAQAAQVTGIGQEVMKQMLPVVAATVMGGLFKQSTGQMGNARVDSDKPLVRMMQLMTRQQGEWAEELGLKQRAPETTGNPFADAFGKMFSGMGGQQAFDPMKMFGPDNPYARAFRDMMEAGMGGATPKAEPEPAPQPEPEAKPEAGAASPYGELFGEMFETGRRTQETYQRTMESIFDQYMAGMKNLQQR